MKLYLVENYIPEMKFNNTGLIIGLTPLACYQLDKAGIDYEIWEDYVDVSELINQYPEYHHHQNLWLKEFDKFLMEIFPQTNTIKLPLATSYSFHLKNIIDSLVLRAKELHVLFKRVNPSQVVYISQSPGKEIIDYVLVFRGNIESLFSRLAPLICKKNNIPFSRVQISSSVKQKQDKRLFIKKISNIQNIKKRISGKKCLKSLWNDIKMIDLYGKTRKTGCLEKIPKANILFLEQNSYIRKIMAQAIKSGHKVYYRSDNSIIRQYCGFHLTKYRIGKSKETELNYDLDAVLQKLKKNTNIMNWLNQFCGVNVESIILPRLAHFIKVLSPEVIFLTNEYAKIYNNLGIEFVFLINCSTSANHAAVAVCKYSQKIKAGYINHGDDAFDFQKFINDHIFKYDMFFVSNDEFAKHLEEKKIKGKFNTDILQVPIRYTIVPQKKLLRHKVQKKKQSLFFSFRSKNKPRVVFVPTMYAWDNNRWIFLWPDTWYFTWHKYLLEYFSKRHDFEFIWKAIPASNETYDPILDIIQERKYQYIRYETSPFANWIPKVDRVLLDYPSTALYESAFARLPVMSLYFKPFCKIRKGAIKEFGNSLQPFSSFNQGIQKVSAFLDTDASDFIAKVPHSKESFINLLSRNFNSEMAR